MIAFYGPATTTAAAAAAALPIKVVKLRLMKSEIHEPLSGSLLQQHSNIYRANDDGTHNRVEHDRKTLIKWASEERCATPANSANFGLGSDICKRNKRRC